MINSCLILYICFGFAEGFYTPPKTIKTQPNMISSVKIK